jgi:hypothetical protein
MKNSKVRKSKTTQKGKTQTQAQEGIDIFLVAKANQFQGFIVVGSRDEQGSIIPDKMLSSARLEWEKKISGKNETKDGKVVTFQDSLVLVSAWLSARGCPKNGNRARLLDIAKSVFGKSFIRLGHLPVALLVRQKSIQSQVELIAVSEKIDLSKPGDVEKYGEPILAFLGDANVIEHFVDQTRKSCGLNDRHTCVDAVLYTNMFAKPKK